MRRAFGLVVFHWLSTGLSWFHLRGFCPWKPLFWQRPFFIGSSIEREAEQILGPFGESTNCDCCSRVGTVCSCVRVSCVGMASLFLAALADQLSRSRTSLVSPFSVYSDSLMSLLWKSSVSISWSPPEIAFSDIPSLWLRLWLVGSI